jgi:HlyD family secretion protein
MPSTRHLIILLSSLFAAFVAYKIWGHFNPAPVTPPGAVMAVSTQLPQPTTFSGSLSLTGNTTPRHEILLFSELNNAPVTQLLVEPGELVSAGQVLATLNPTTSRHQLTQLASAYTQAADAYRRIESISGTGAVAAAEVVAKRSAMQNAKAQLAEAQSNVSRSSIVAPTAGLVFERQAVLGAIPSQNQPLFRLASKAEIEVAATVPESDIGQIAPGQSVTLKLTGFPEAISGSVRLVAPQINPSTRTADVRIALLTSRTIPVGLFANVAVEQTPVSGFAIASSAVMEDPSGTYVWQVSPENRLTAAPVSVKLNQNGVAIVENLSPSTSVVVRAGAFLKEGDLVTPITEPASK